jgi:hypothetical protein
MTAELDNPEKITEDAFAKIAMKDTVASLAGHGVEVRDVTEVEMTFTSNSTDGRRLSSNAGNFVVNYVLTVPDSISSECASSIRNTAVSDIRTVLQPKFVVVGEDVMANVTSISVSSPKVIPSNSRTGFPGSVTTNMAARSAAGNLCLLWLTLVIFKL